MSKSRTLSGLVSDGGALADGQLNAQDIGAQPALVSGTTIKTVNGTSLLGSGNIVIAGGGGGGGGAINIDGGFPDSSYTGVSPIDGGTA
jgi:hypothetical protein